MSEHPFEMYDGAYILGALSEEDRRAYEQHLLVCDRCSESVAQLRDIPHALAAVPASVLETETPPPSLLPSLLQRTRRERNRRRWIVGSLVAAAAACIVALSIVVAQPDHTGASHPVAMQAVADSPIKATADVRSVDWGTRIDLVCRYYEPVTAGRPYALIVVDRSGERHTLGTWNLVPGKVAKYGSGTSLTRDKIAAVQIATVDGQRALLTLNL